MPFRSRKRKARKPRKSRKPRTSLMRAPTFRTKGVFGDSLVRTLRYVTEFTMNAGISSQALYTFKANSIFDPDHTGSGHQPMGADELSIFFEKYVVLSSRIVVHALHQGDHNSSNASIIYGYCDNNSGPPATSPTTWIEQRRGSYRVIAGGNSAKTYTTMPLTYYPKKVFGIKDIQDLKSLAGTTGSGGSDPTDIAYFNIGTSGFQFATDPAEIRCYAIIDYKVLYTHPEPLPAS